MVDEQLDTLLVAELRGAPRLYNLLRAQLGARRAPVPMLARLHSSLRDLASSFNTWRRHTDERQVRPHPPDTHPPLVPLPSDSVTARRGGEAWQALMKAQLERIFAEASSKDVKEIASKALA